MVTRTSSYFRGLSGYSGFSGLGLSGYSGYSGISGYSAGFPIEKINVVDYSYSINYDGTGKIESIEYENGKKITYEYDGNDNLITESAYDTDGTTLIYYYTYTYDGDNNITNVEYTQI